VALALLLPLYTLSCVPDAPRHGRDASAARVQAIRVAEDLRAPDSLTLQVLLDGTRDPDAEVRRVAVRALGRLERPEMTSVIEPLLADDDPPVRAEAANAMAQAVHATSGAPVLQALLDRVSAERNAVVRGVLARSLGRLDVQGDGRRAVEAALLALSYGPDGGPGGSPDGGPKSGDAPPQTLLGVALGAESYVRLHTDHTYTSSALRRRLGELARYGVIPPVAGASRIRSLAVTALGRAHAFTLPQVQEALDDPQTRVRRAGLAALGTIAPDLRHEPIRRGLLDRSVTVRIEAVRALARMPRDRITCTRLLALAARDVSPHVRLLALDALAEPCPEEMAAADTLAAVAASLDPEDDTHWHAPAHALLALASLAPDRTRPLLGALAADRNPFARRYAVLTAAKLRYAEALRTLAADPSPNVRTAAVAELFRLIGHDADSFLMEQLEHDDPALLLTAARLLEGSANAHAVAEAAFAAFRRISARREQTLRDPRRVLLRRVAEGRPATWEGALHPYLEDYDPVVAGDVADILSRWAGRRVRPHPTPLPPLPFPDPAELRRLQHTTVVLHMRRGGVIEIGLFPDLAPTNAARFARMARTGALDGLTFHRVVPDFVLQGGSPGANEYAGHGAYTRDEVGLAVHWRGTVGVSTRGRDTGDGQIFINLIDNVRLDHDYTVLGRVSAGLRYVYDVLEGDVIEKAEVRLGR